jgi:uncharacterized protein with HEPN domain
MFVDDKTRLRHMLDAAREALEFSRGKNRALLAGDRQLALALTKCIEIIGEAAARVSDPTRQLYPAIPWGQIVGMRNRLIHGYYEVDLDRLWDTVTKNVPQLVEALERGLGERS